MSNIDKRALREIAVAAVGAHERLSVMPPDDIFDISLAEGTQLDADITALNALNSAANPTTVLALLDELEAKDKRIAELEARQLVVKIPAYVDGRTLGYGEVNHMIDLCVDAFERACHSAGINLTVEG